MAFCSARLTLSMVGLLCLPLFAVNGCGGDDDDGGAGGSSGTGGGGANTCPPVLFASGASPGIVCDEDTGDACADSEQFCECGAETIEGRPWLCVPAAPSCPETAPEAGDSCGTDGIVCDFVVVGERSSCTCHDGAWVCAPSACPIQRPLNGAACTGRQGLECSVFVAGSMARPNDARNLPCTCGDDEIWRCDDGCPAEFPGEGAACDPAGPVNCSWATETGSTFCGCNGVWNCL